LYAWLDLYQVGGAGCYFIILLSVETFFYLNQANTTLSRQIKQRDIIV